MNPLLESHDDEPEPMELDDVRHWVRSGLWDQVPMRIAVIDRDYKIIEANRAFSEAYGDWRERHCYAVYKGRTEKCTLCNAEDAFEWGLTKVYTEEGIVVDDQQTYYQVRSVSIVKEDGSIPYVIELSADITGIKVLEKEKLEAERLAAVGQTVAGLAHGIKNLLMGLDGGMYMARTGIEQGNPERLIEGWNILEENVERISSFVREFLEFARGRKPRVHLIDPNAPARKVLELFRDTAKLAGLQLRADLQVDIAPAPMDEKAIHTCLANLISNALDACETSDEEHGRVTLKTYERDDVIIYEVADNGIGMDYDVKKKVFTNFFSTKSAGKGTGLGLLTTSKIVQEHGGKVSFESKEGEGAVFRLAFPRERLPSPSPVDSQTVDSQTVDSKTVDSKTADSPAVDSKTSSAEEER